MSANGTETKRGIFLLVFVLKDLSLCFHTSSFWVVCSVSHSASSICRVRSHQHPDRGLEHQTSLQAPPSSSFNLFQDQGAVITFWKGCHCHQWQHSSSERRHNACSSRVHLPGTTFPVQYYATGTSNTICGHPKFVHQLAELSWEF